MSASGPSGGSRAALGPGQSLQVPMPADELSRPAAARYQSNRTHCEGFSRPRSSTFNALAPLAENDYLSARPASTVPNPDATVIQPGQPPRRRSMSLSNALKRFSRPPPIAPVEEAAGSNIPPSPDDIDPRYIQARNRYNQQVVDFLDAIDPEVATVTDLADMQNSLFVPNLGAYLDRSRPFRLSRPPLDTNKPLPPPPTSQPTSPRSGRTSQESLVQAGEFLVMPRGWVDWGALSDSERRELDEYVHYLLTSKKERLKRTWRGFKQYVRTPLGAFIVIYASLLTFWGAAWVLFLIGWLSAGSQKHYFVEICDQVLTALFCVVGINLTPFRAVDTYHMIYIAIYHRRALRLRREKHLAPLPDENDLPAEETTKRREQVLSEMDQLQLEYHQNKFSSNHTFYRPHETDTHRAFPLDLLIVVVCILDCHSLFQIALGSATWSISYHKEYKKILTAVILSLSISCNITGGILIAVGNRRTRKMDVLEQRLHAALSEEAIRRKEKARRKKIMHESIDEKEARLKAEKEAEPGFLDKVKEKIDEEGNSSGFLDRIMSDDGHRRSHSHRSSLDGNESGKSTPKAKKSASVDTTTTGGSRSRKATADTPLRAHHETEEEHAH